MSHRRCTTLATLLVAALLAAPAAQAAEPPPNDDVADAVALTLIEHLAALTGLHLPTEALQELAQANRTEIDEQIGRSPENTAVVAALEQQFDTFQAAREDNGLLGASGAVPSGDQIASEFERFLADQDRRPRD